MTIMFCTTPVPPPRPVCGVITMVVITAPAVAPPEPSAAAPSLKPLTEVAIPLEDPSNEPVAVGPEPSMRRVVAGDGEVAGGCEGGAITPAPGIAEGLAPPPTTVLRSVYVVAAMGLASEPTPLPPPPVNAN